MSWVPDGSSSPSASDSVKASSIAVSQPTVSHHLKKLREAGLLTSERRGTWVYYQVAPSVVAAMSAMLDPRG